MAAYRVALTGGAGAGKSAAAQMFAECGAFVVDADNIAHEFMEPGQEINAIVRATFGEEIADSEGHIVRALLRQRVFTDPAARKTLEAILHPPIHEALRKRSEDAHPYALLVIPLLAEIGRPDFVNRVLVIDVNTKEQKRRLQARGLANQTIENLLAIQASGAKRRALADDVIANNGSPAELLVHVRALHEHYLLRPGPRVTP